MEERLAQNQPERTSGEGSVDLGSVVSLPDWPCNDLDDSMQTGDGQSSPQIGVGSHQDPDEIEEVAARVSPESRNDSSVQIEAIPSVPIAVMTNVSSTAIVPSLPDLLHSDRCVDSGLDTQ